MSASLKGYQNYPNNPACGSIANILNSIPSQAYLSHPAASEAEAARAAVIRALEFQMQRLRQLVEQENALLVAVAKGELGAKLAKYLAALKQA